MDKLMKLNSLLHEQEEREWKFRYKTKEVIVQMGYMRSMWDDNASRELWKKFAIPFDDASAKAVAHHQKAFGSSSALRAEGEQLYSSCIRVSGLSEEIGEKLKVAKREHTSCDRSMAEGKDFLQKVEQDTPIIDKEMEDWSDDNARFVSLYSNRQNIY